MNKNPGFTLIELLVVVLIIGILSAVALPQYQNAVEKSRASEAFSILKTLQNQQALCVLTHGESDSCGAGKDNIGKSWNNANDNLFTTMDIDLPGGVDSGCGSDLCGPATKYFTYAIDVRDIVAIRRPAGSKYLLITNAWPGDGWRNRIWCLNSDANKNWCKAIGFTEEDGGVWFQP